MGGTGCREVRTGCKEIIQEALVGIQVGDYGDFELAWRL